MIKRILIAFILLTILLVGAIVILPGLVPTDTYRAKLESQLSQTFGRDVSISGDIKLSTLPLIKVETGPVTLSNPTGFSANDFVNIQGMSAKVKLWPLLSKQVEISGISLDDGVLASPFDFLSGDETSFDAKVDTGEGSFEAVGEFLKSRI